MAFPYSNPKKQPGQLSGVRPTKLPPTSEYWWISPCAQLGSGALQIYVAELFANSQSWHILVVEPPLWKIWVRQLGWLFPIYIYGTIIQMFQTTNQLYIFDHLGIVPPNHRLRWGHDRRRKEKSSDLARLTRTASQGWPVHNLWSCGGYRVFVSHHPSKHPNINRQKTKSVDHGYSISSKIIYFNPYNP